MPDLTYENQMYEKGYTAVCGCDEAGRGPLCGPVVAAAVILPRDCVIEGLDDSKKLTEKKREKLYDVICREAVAYGIAESSPADTAKHAKDAPFAGGFPKKKQSVVPTANFTICSIICEIAVGRISFLP